MRNNQLLLSLACFLLVQCEANSDCHLRKLKYLATELLFIAKLKSMSIMLHTIESTLAIVSSNQLKDLPAFTAINCMCT